MNKDLNPLQAYQSHFLQGNEHFHQAYELHIQNIAQVREFLEAEDLICNKPVA